MHLSLAGNLTRAILSLAGNQMPIRASPHRKPNSALSLSCSLPSPRRRSIVQRRGTIRSFWSNAAGALSSLVVKRAVSGSVVEPMPAAGTKRSVRDRLGSNAYCSYSNGSGSLRNSNKRQRGDIDARIGKDDLWYKLMKKNGGRRAQSGNDQRHGDLNEKLSKTVQRPLPSLDSRSRKALPELQDSGFLGRVPSTRSVDDMSHVDSLRNSYSSWTLDHLRQRSPERVQVTYRPLSPPGNVEKLQMRPSNRTYDGVRPVPYMNTDTRDATRHVSTAPFMSNTALPPGPAEHMAHAPPLINQVHQPISAIQKPSYVGDEQLTRDGLLQHLGLGKYATIFKAEEIDMAALKQMGENDLKELGIPMGPRKKLLLALLPRPKRPMATNIR